MQIELTDQNYVKNVENFEEAIFIDFYSPMCGPCQEVLALLPILDRYFEEKVMVAKVDVTRNPKLAKKFEISSVPFCVSVHHQSKMVADYEMGAASSERYIKMIEKAQGKKSGIFSLFSKIFS